MLFYSIRASGFRYLATTETTNHTIKYHWKTKDGEYKEYKISMSEYLGYEDSKQKALSDKDGFRIVKQEELPLEWVAETGAYGVLEYPKAENTN